MGAYILSLMVTLDQECAIQKLFTKKKWQFIRIDQTTSDGCSNISGTFTLVGKNGKKDNVAGGVKSKKKSARQLNVTSIVEGCNVNNENEHEISGDIDTASEQEFQALGITVKEEVLSDNDEENFVDNDSDYDADGIGETSGMTQVKRATKRRDDSETCEMDEEEPSVKLETGEISQEDDANILAMLEEMPDVKHISELLTSECPNSDPSSMAIPDLETDANGYVTSLSVYFCKWCNYTFPELEYFKGHKRKGRCFFVCQFCKEKFTFRNFSRYQDHLREHRTGHSRESPKYTGLTSSVTQKGRKRKREPKTIEEKYAAIIECEMGIRSKSDIAREYDVPSSTLSTWLKNKDSIIKGCQKFGPKRKSMKTGNFDELEEVLREWFYFTTSTTNKPITGPMIQSKAEELAIDMSVANFKASNGWLDRFKERYGILFRKVCGDSDSYSVNVTL